MRLSRAMSLARNLAGATIIVIGSAVFFFKPLHGAELAPSGGDSYVFARGSNEFGLWAGGSPDSADLIGTTEDRKLALFALRYGRVLRSWDSLSLEYTLDIFPAAVLFEPNRVRKGKSILWSGCLSFGFQNQLWPAELDQTICRCQRWFSLL